MTLHTLYRFYGSGENLLYVGITKNPPSRLGDHIDGQWWWLDVRGIALTHYPDRESLTRAEVHAIRTEHPEYNITHAAPAGQRDNPIRTYTCACGKDAIYHRRLDRYFHVDGSGNRSCWAAFGRGEVGEINPRRTLEIAL